MLFPSPGDLPHPGIEPGFPALQADDLPSEPPEKPPEKEMEAHSSIFAWRIPRTGEPGGLQSMGLHFKKNFNVVYSFCLID